MKISFHGATRTVTGSKHLITLWDEEKILLDCGMYQGLGKDTAELNGEFGFDAQLVNHVILSHAHVDHSGLLPKLVKDGYKGKIYCTPATYDLCEIMLMDSAHIQEADIKYINQKREKQNQELLQPLYTTKDVEACLPHFVRVPYNKKHKINNHIDLTFTDNGHILGSATVNLKIREVNEITRLAFTGDIGRYDTALLKDPAPFPQADVIICESTYGDRLHEGNEDTEQEILKVVLDTCVVNKGKLIIPAFSLGRTQEIVYALNKLNLHGLIPNIKIFVDSPLAVSATNIMRKYAHCLNDEVQSFIEARPDPFGFDKLTYTNSKEESQQLNDMKGPFIIISAAGMAEAGRVKHHIMNTIHDSRNTILIVGYAEPLSLAGRLKSGSRFVKIFGSDMEVKAGVKAIDSLSAHGDYTEMIKYLSCQDSEKIKNLFLVHGDLEAQTAFKEHLHEAGFRNIYIPAKGNGFKI